MQPSSLELDTLAQLDGIAAGRYEEMADVASALAAFASEVGRRQEPVRQALAALPEVERQLDALGAVVKQLDESTRQLAAELGVPAATGGAASSRS